MPEFTGLELIDSLRQEDLLKSKNIIIFIASFDKKHFVQLNDSGVKGIIKKPSSLDELNTRIREISASSWTLTIK